jgi:hypothetical protein
MAVRVDVVPTQISRAGVKTPTETTGTAEGLMFANNGYCWIEVRNSDADNPYSVTIVTTATVDGKVVEDIVKSIPKTETWTFGPFPVDVYNKQSGADAGKVYVNFEAAHESAFKVRAYRMG